MFHGAWGSVRDVVCSLVCSMEQGGGDVGVSWSKGGLLGMLSVVWYVPWSRVWGEVC